MVMRSTIVEPVLARLDAAATDKQRCNWSALLSVCGAPDDRIFVRPERELSDRPAAAARWLADYRGPASRGGPLVRALDGRGVTAPSYQTIGTE
jgi:hypothetical protein